MPAHKLHITLDEATDEVTAEHRCTVTIGEHVISHSRELELDEGAAAALKGILDLNRALVESEANRMAIRHVAAVEDKPEPGVHRIKVSGTLGALGGTAVKKSE